MKLHPLILRDHYRRWWWAHLVGFLLFGAIGGAVGRGLDPHKIPLGAGAFLGAVTLAVALNALTNARTLLSLPLRASELGTTFWWIAVPLSALAPTAGLAVGWIVSGLFGSSVPVDVAAVLRFLLLTQAVSAFQFTVLCFMPNADTSDPREKILGGFTGAFWGIGLSASCSFTMFWPESRLLWDPLSCGILAMGAVCGLVSWNRRTAFLLHRARKNEGATPTARPMKRLPQASRLDGFAGLYLRTLFRMAGVGLAFSAVVGGIMAWSGTGNMALMRMGSAWMVMGALTSVMTCLGSLRHWRTLPISAERISWVMIGLLLTGWSGLMLPLIAMHWLVGQTLGWSESGLLVLAGGLFAVLLAFALRFGMKWFMLLLWFVLIAPPMLSLVLDRFSEEGGRQPAMVASVLAGVLLLVIAQAWMTRILRHQSRIFNPGFHQFGRLNTGA